MIGNEERRQFLSAQHDQLRILIGAVRCAAGVVLATHEGHTDTAVQSLRKAVRELGLQLAAHLEMEEAILAPLLPRADARRSMRLELMRAEHARQRSILSALGAADSLPYALARRAASLAVALLIDIASEESDFVTLLPLGADVSKPVVVGSPGRLTPSPRDANFTQSGTVFDQ